MKRTQLLFSTLLALSAVSATDAFAGGDKCAGLPTHEQLKAAITKAKAASNGGFATEMWGAVVNRAGIVCGVAYTGEKVSDQWPGSRLIAVSKAYTANAFSLPKLSVSTANLFTAVQNGNPLQGLANGNPLDVSVAYKGCACKFGQEHDPLVGERVGGTITFGGGLALYNEKHELVGAIGLSGDSSCADHHIAWRARNELQLDYVPGGVSPDKVRADNIVYDISAAGKSASGWGHPSCAPGLDKIAKELAPTRK